MIIQHPYILVKIIDDGNVYFSRFLMWRDYSLIIPLYTVN